MAPRLIASIDHSHTPSPPTAPSMRLFSMETVSAMRVIWRCWFLVSALTRRQRLADIAVLAVAMGEQLHRHHVGVAVDDAAGEQRVALRRSSWRADAHGRHEAAQRQDVERDPRHDRHGEAPVGLGEQDHRAHRIDGDVPERVDHLDHRAAQGRARLQHAGGDAAGEVALEIAQRLAHHPAIGLPADQAADIGGDGLAHQQVVQAVAEGPRDHHHEGHPQHQHAVLGEDRGRAGGLQQVDDLADIAEQRHLDDGDEEGGAAMRRRTPSRSGARSASRTRSALPAAA